MARRTKRITTKPGYVKYLRTSDEDAQAPERSQNGQRRDIERLLRTIQRRGGSIGLKDFQAAYRAIGCFLEEVCTHKSIRSALASLLLPNT